MFFCLRRFVCEIQHFAVICQRILCEYSLDSRPQEPPTHILTGEERESGETEPDIAEIAGQ